MVSGLLLSAAYLTVVYLKVRLERTDADVIYCQARLSVGGLAQELGDVSWRVSHVVN